MPNNLARMLAEKFVEFKDKTQQIEAELRTYRQILDTAPCPMALMSKEGLAEYVNLSYCEMLGVTSDQVLANGWACVIDEADAERTKRLWQHVVSNQLREFSAWSRLKTPSGVIPIYWRAALLDTNGYIIALFHPACAFFKYPSGCGFVNCDVKLWGTLPDAPMTPD